MRVIFDSNVFDDIIAGRLSVSVLIRKRVKIYITHKRIAAQGGRALTQRSFGRCSKSRMSESV